MPRSRWTRRPCSRASPSWLAPASVRVHYPGVWLAERVWATHGHYLDRHLLPEVAYGIARGLLGRLPRDGATPADYEQAGGPSITRLEALLTHWLPRPLAALWDDLVEVLRAATMPGIPRRLLGRRIAPLTAMLLGAQARRASIPALGRVVHRLGVDAEWVVFGHVHRCGPLGGDDPAPLAGPGGRPRLANTGSWVYEPLLVHRAARPTRTGPAERSCSRTTASRRPWGCSTISTPPRCIDRRSIDHGVWGRANQPNIAELRAVACVCQLSQGCGDVPVSQNGRGMLLEHSEVPRAEGAVGVGRIEQRRRAFDAGRNLLLIAGRPGLVEPGDERRQLPQPAEAQIVRGGLQRLRGGHAPAESLRLAALNLEQLAVKAQQRGAKGLGLVHRPVLPGLADRVHDLPITGEN